MTTNIIYNEDIFQGIEQRVKDNSLDLVICDPPYNLGIDTWDVFKNNEEFYAFIEKWVIAIKNKVKKNGTVYIYNTPYNSSKILQIMEKYDFKFIDWITWYKKDGFSNNRKKYINNQETITMYSKNPKDITFNYNDIREEYTSKSRINAAKKTGIKKNGKIWFPDPRGKMKTNVWEDSSFRHSNKLHGKTTSFIHKTIKPKKQIKRMILASSNKNDLILDAFAGSGTTTIISKELKRNSIGFENNIDYYNFFKKRLENENYL